MTRTRRPRADVKKVYVDCSRAGAVFRTYDFGIPIPLTGWPGLSPQDGERLKDEAKGNLTNEGLAGPPYAGITFRVRL